MKENRANDDFIDLVELFHVLLNKWWLIVICAIVGAAVALGGTLIFITPQYESKAMLYILNKTTSVTSLADIQIGSALTEDFGIIAKSKPVIDGAIDKMKEEDGKSFTRQQVLDMLMVTNEADTRILVIGAVGENPVDVCLVANAVAEETASQMAEIMKSDPPTTVEAAEVSQDPVSPNIKKNTMVGFLAGAVSVCGVLLVLFLMNDNIKTEEDVHKYLGAPTLVVIPYVKGKERKKEELKRQKEEMHEKKK